MTDTECPTCEHYACGRECACDCERARLILARAEAAEARYAALVAALPECTECDAKATHGHYDAAMFACDEHARDGTRWYEMGHAAIVRADAVRA